MQDTMHTYDGTEVDVELVEPRGQGGARLDIKHPDGRRWRLDVSRSGDTEIVTTWRDGELADLDVPAWLADNLSREAAPA